jgi:hypothetical protein
LANINLNNTALLLQIRRIRSFLNVVLPYPAELSENSPQIGAQQDPGLNSTNKRTAKRIFQGKLTEGSQKEKASEEQSTELAQVQISLGTQLA